MIDIYTERKDSKDWIFYNDLYFNLNTGNEDMSQKEIDLIQQVDEAKLTPDKHIETKPTLFDIPDDAKIRFNDSDIVTGSRGYNAWWSKEYARREANDL